MSIASTEAKNFVKPWSSPPSPRKSNEPSSRAMNPSRLVPTNTEPFTALLDSVLRAVLVPRLARHREDVGRHLAPRHHLRELVGHGAELLLLGRRNLVHLEPALLHLGHRGRVLSRHAGLERRLHLLARLEHLGAVGFADLGPRRLRHDETADQRRETEP